MAKAAREELRERIDAIEGAYEYFLAYAAQGLREASEGSRVIGQFKRHLDGMADSVSGLGDCLDRLLREEDVHAEEKLKAFADVITADAARAGTVIQVVQAQPFATSQLVDNLNASTHLRALLTDLFLVDELLGLGVDLSPAARAPDPA
jgi:hypothetical protein